MSGSSLFRLISCHHLSVWRLTLVCLCLLCCQDISAQLWKLHPAFDRSPVRIMDTPDKTYFLVHQQVYDKSLAGYDFSSLALFVYDKGDEENGIQPLTDSVRLSSADIRMVQYSPKGDYLIVGYNDGGIDIVDNAGEVHFIDRLKRNSLPGMSVISSISIDPESGDAWIAAGDGYMRVAAGKYVPDAFVSVEDGVKAACRVGSRMIVLKGDKILVSEKEKPRSASDFTLIDNIESVSALIPLGNYGFAYIKGVPGGNNQLMSAHEEAGKWITASQGSDTFYAIPETNALTGGYETNILPNKEGYLLYSAGKMWQLDVSNGDGVPALYSLVRDNSETPVGSWDFSDFWVYRERGSFVRRNADYKDFGIDVSAAWKDMSRELRPDAPAAMISNYMAYTPDCGMLVMNHGYINEFSLDRTVNPPLLSAYKNGIWSVMSPAYTAPAAVDDNQSLKTIYNNNINRFPIPDPNGFLIDPLNKDYYICGSQFGGIMFKNLSDIRKDAVIFGAGDNPVKDFPGFVDIVPRQTWSPLCSFSAPDYDNSGTVWSLYSNAFESGGSQPKGQLKYITAENRNKIYAADASEYGSLESWQTIMLPFKNYIHWTGSVVACKHPDNANIVVVDPGSSHGELLILNHKGTLSDISDDETRLVTVIRDENGSVREMRRPDGISEDPVTGEIISMNEEGVFRFNPNSECENGTISGSAGLFSNKEREIIPETERVMKIIFDPSGRMWIATLCNGVYGVSADRQTLLAHYTKANSPLPSDQVYGLGWNDATQSLMISTQKGLAEVFPEIPGNAAGYNGNPSLNISAVHPGYNGNVEIRGLKPFMQIVVKNKEGETVRILSNGTSSRIGWDLKNNSGGRVSAGIYKIYVDGGAPMEIIVMSEE